MPPGSTRSKRWRENKLFVGAACGRDYRDGTTLLHASLKTRQIIMTISFRTITHYAVGVALTSGLLCGCSLLPRTEFKQPQVAMPEKWEGGVVTGTAVANRERWWKTFNDNLLDELIDRALRTNN